MTVTQEKQIIQHGKNIKKLFQLKSIDAITLYKKLRRVESRIHINVIDRNNGDITKEQYEDRETAALNTLDVIINFRAQNVPVFVGSNSRGYALKIKERYIRDNNIDIYRDWGGYGIIALGNQ